MELKSSYKSQKRHYRYSSNSDDISRNNKIKNGSSKRLKSEVSYSSNCYYSKAKKHRPPLRRKMSLYWDVPPPGFEYLSTADYKKMLENGEALESITPCTRQVLVPVLSATITRQARRLYVGNIPFGVTEDELLNFFNIQLQLMSLCQADGNPALACQINLEKNFAFLEFRSIDETTQAMAMDNFCFKGQYLKVRRPHDYQPLPGDTDITPAPMPMTPVVPGIISNSVPDSQNKIFIGGLPNFITDDQVIELLQAFGELRGFNMIKDTKSGLNKGYAFCEYLDPSITNSAITSLNGMLIGNRKISVQRAISSSRNSAEISTSVIRLLNSAKLKKDEATEILCLLNMITIEDLKDDDEIADIKCDVREECENFGTVQSIEIPRPIEDKIVQGCGKIFIEFNSIYDCQKAQQALTGRKFNGRTVITSYYDPKKFHRHEFQ